jgi:hypothetical protein
VLRWGCKAICGGVLVGVLLAGTPAAADAAAARKNQAGCGNKYAGATAAKSNLAGSACMPKADEASSDSKVGLHFALIATACCCGASAAHLV